MKTIFHLLVGIVLSMPLLAQPPITLRLAFNAEQNRYEVYAKPMFTASNYVWGPSQVSVVLPGAVADGSLSARSTAVGLWLDQSTVFAPASAPNADFHGFTSQGGKTDLVAGREQLLFDFALPQGFLAGVRLYDNQLDPGSARAGMQGGDFGSYVSSARGEQGVGLDTRKPELAGLTATKTVGDAGARQPVTDADEATTVVVYPNPSSQGLFRLYMQGFGTGEVVEVRLSTLSGTLLQHFSESVSTLAGRAILVPNPPDDFVLIQVTRPARRQHFSQQLLIKE